MRSFKKIQNKQPYKESFLNNLRAVIPSNFRIHCRRLNILIVMISGDFMEIGLLCVIGFRVNASYSIF